ncbi:MAG: hypothetical protein ABIP33_06150 [Pseudolysinimonas sp.]
MSRFSQKGIDPTVEASEYDAFLEGYENDLRSLPFVRSSVAKKDWALKNDRGQWPGPGELWDLERSLVLRRPQAHAAYAATGRPQAPEPPGLDGPPLPETPFRQFIGDERVAGLGGGFGAALALGRHSYDRVRYPDGRLLTSVLSDGDGFLFTLTPPGRRVTSQSVSASVGRPVTLLDPTAAALRFGWEPGWTAAFGHGHPWPVLLDVAAQDHRVLLMYGVPWSWGIFDRARLADSGAVTLVDIATDDPAAEVGPARAEDTRWIPRRRASLLPPTDKQAVRRGVPVPPILTVGARIGTDEQLVRWSIIVNDYLRDVALVPAGFGPDAPDPFPDPTSRELFRSRLREERRAYLRIAAILDFIPDFAPPGLGDDDGAPGILA